MDFRAELITLLAKYTTKSPQEIHLLLSIPPDSALGDYAFPCFTLGRNPHEAAAKLQQHIVLPPFVSKIEVAGPYLNFFLNQALLMEKTLTAILQQKDSYGHGKAGKNIIVEYCGPNTNKPLHLGHLRNMALGNALCRIMAFQGHKVHAVNIVNDRGIHICQSLLAYQKWGQGKKPDARKQASWTSASRGKKGDHFVGDYYVLFAQHAAEEEKQGKDQLKKEAQELLLRWELGDTKIRALWKQMSAWVLAGFKETYKRFGVEFEKEYFESAYYAQGKAVVEEGLHKKLFQKDHTDAVVAPLEDIGLPNKVLLRGDETSLYITQDLHLADLRYKDFRFDRMMYVVASEQQLHFQQLFAILKLLKRPYAGHLYHFSYGLVHLPTGRMKSREGTVVDADDIMDEMSHLAEREVRKRHKDISQKDLKRRAEAIALAAIKFFMLRTDAVRDIIFNPEESLSFEGETGPYLQYTHARAGSILRKARKSSAKAKVEYALLVQPEEHHLAKLLAQFPAVIEEAATQHKLHVLCRYLLDVAQLFNEFYHRHQVISDDKTMMRARLQLVKAVKQVLANGLSLLGIEALEEM